MGISVKKMLFVHDWG